MGCGMETAVTEFRPSYRRAVKMQASLAVLGFVFALLAWLLDAHIGWLVGGLLLGAVVPFTLIVIMPTNKTLLDPALDMSLAQPLLVRWGRLHLVRSVLGLIAFVIFLLLLAQS